MLLTVVVVLIAALALRLRDAPPPVGDVQGNGPQTGGGARDADAEAALGKPRRLAGLPACPTGADGPGHAALGGVIVECAADGSAVDVGRAVAGHKVVLNFWAYWCLPCRAELPAMAEYQRRTSPEVTVATVHQDENEAAALLRLAELGVRLPTFQDDRRRIAAALRVPNVMPATVVLDASGSVAQILPREFASAEEIAAAVGD